MTAIAGFIHDGHVWMGGDSAGVGSSWDLGLRADQKVFRNGEFIFGFTTSFRMGQLLRYKFQPPKQREEQHIMAFMVTDFMDAVRDCLKAGGWAKKEHEAETGGVFLVGYRGRLFRIDMDYQVGESLDGYEACGCAEQILRGALFVTTELPPGERMELVLHAAERHSAGVRGPFHIETL